MDGLIILLFFVFVGSMIAKRARQPGKTQNETYRHPNAQTSHEHGARVHPQIPGNAKKPTIEHTMSSRTEPAVPYQAIKSMLQRDSSIYNYTGSLGVTSSEGEPSAEGNSSNEGGEVFSKEVLYASQNVPTAPPIDTLPTDWDGPTMVRAVVMHEILKRPHGWSGHRG